MSFAVAASALALDAALGDPPALWRRTGHPVTWFGAAIAASDQTLNRGRAKVLRGAVALGVVIVLFAVPAVMLHMLLGLVPFGWVLEAALASTLLAHRSLHEHVRAVASAESLAEQRRAVSMIVGRDTRELDDAGVARAGLEALSESLSDGVVAPALWLAVGGLPGIVIYKVVNTADSMIGHRTPRHEQFGKASARLDDLLNLVPARLTALLICAIAPRIVGGWRALIADARRHVSPNAGWPEAALARALNVSLGGPRSYAGRHVYGHWINAAGQPPGRSDILRGLRVSLFVGVLQLAVYGALSLV